MFDGFDVSQSASPAKVVHVGKHEFLFGCRTSPTPNRKDPRANLPPVTRSVAERVTSSQPHIVREGSVAIGAKGGMVVLGGAKPRKDAMSTF